MTAGIAYRDGPRLARSSFAAADWVAAGRDEVNRINVFSVPDGDTGTNLTLTLRAVADALRTLGDASLPDTARTMPASATNGTAPESVSVPAALVEVAAERDFRFCTEVLVRGDQLPAANEVRASLHQFGGSLVVAVAGDILKIHVHTDTPEAVFSYASPWGRVETTKADHISLVPLQVAFEDATLLARRLTPRPRALRFGVAHAEAPEMAERIRTALVAAYRPKDGFTSLATGVLGTHVGVGAWAIFYQAED